MEIQEMRATFGKLQDQTLSLKPGLNCICAPNESGKSTWSHFLRIMLYGLSTRERGDLADKNRFAPWSGAAMRGQLQVADGNGTSLTLSRDTRRANAPMGQFACTYTGTATAVPGIDGQNAGETLLGVPREVFERSAFIRQSALAVDSDAELERRIAALITTGEEDTSYTESYDRLKRQLNRRRHNKTGLIPALERDIDQLRAALREVDALNDQAQQSRREVDALERRAAELQQQAAQSHAQARQERLNAYRSAEQAALTAQSRADALAADTATLPDSASLTLLEGQAAALPGELSALTEKRRAAEDAEAVSARVQEALTQHPLYPAAEPELRQRAAAIVPEKAPSLFLPIFSGLLIPLCVTLAFLLRSKGALPFWLFMGMAALGAVATVFAVRVRQQAIRERQRFAETQRTALEEQIAEYLPLRQQAADAEDGARRARLAAEESESSCRRRLREVYRLHTPELKQGYDIILVARVRTAHAPWPEIQKQFLKLCRKLDLLEEAQ